MPVLNLRTHVSPNTNAEQTRHNRKANAHKMRAARVSCACEMRANFSTRVLCVCETQLLIPYSRSVLHMHAVHVCMCMCKNTTRVCAYGSSRTAVKLKHVHYILIPLSCIYIVYRHPPVSYSPQAGPETRQSSSTSQHLPR